MALKRILCPFHEESTPSCVIYETNYKCYACGAHGPLSDLDTSVKPAKKEPPEDLIKSMSYIGSLDYKTIRGLSLPCDLKHYYVVWPDKNYYKKRAIVSEGSSKYLCPRGHWKPLFHCYKAGNKTLAIVEGEINALSLSTTKPPFDVCSPGGTSDFYGKNYDKYSKIYLTYEKFLVIVDRDEAGVKAALEIKSNLLKHSPYVEVVLMEEDCNDILTKYGPEALKERFNVTS